MGMREEFNKFMFTHLEDGDYRNPDYFLYSELGAKWALEKAAQEAEFRKWSAFTTAERIRQISKELTGEK